VKKGLGLDQRPELIADYFGNYDRVVYLAQSDNARLRAMAEQQAAYLGLGYTYVFCGLEPLAKELELKINQRQ
jgi:hypothetical protein